MWAVISTVVFHRKDFLCDGDAEYDLLAIAKFPVLLNSTLEFWYSSS